MRKITRREIAAVSGEFCHERVDRRHVGIRGRTFGAPVGSNCEKRRTCTVYYNSCAGIAFVTQMALARSLGHEGYGEFAYAFGWLQLMLVFAQGGFSTAALRFVAEYRVRRQALELRGFLTRASQIALLETVVIACMLAGCAVAWSHSSSDRTLHNFLIASAALPALSQIILHSAFVRGFGHVIPSMAFGLVQPLVFVTLLATAACILRNGLTSTDALLLMFAAALCALATIVSLRRRYEHELKLCASVSFAPMSGCALRLR